MTMKNNSLAEKCKVFGRKAFVKIGDFAVGNSSSEDTRGNTQAPAFSLFQLWPEERPMPRRRK